LKDFLIGYLCILGTVLLTVYGQLVIKWQIIKAGAFPEGTTEKVWFLLCMVFNPWVISSLAGAFLAFLLWMVAMTRFELSHAYPFMSLSFVFVLVLSGFFFHESITLPKLLGVLLIMSGIIVGAQG